MYSESYTREARFLTRWDQETRRRRGLLPVATGEASTTSGPGNQRGRYSGDITQPSTAVAVTCRANFSPPVCPRQRV